MQLFARDRMWRSHDLKRSYDVVIVGAGVHGLATAYYLARNTASGASPCWSGGYLGAGNSGRNTAIIRANYRTPEGIPFYARSVRAVRAALRRSSSWNVLFTQHGHLTLAHTDSSINGLRVRAEMNRLLGVDSRLIGPEEIAPAGAGDGPGRHARATRSWRRCTTRRAGSSATTPWCGATPAACDRMGVEIHPFTEVTGDHGGRQGPRRARGGARHRRRDRPGRDRGRDGGQLHRRLGDDRLPHGGRRAADRDAPPPGVRDRAASSRSWTR